MTSDAVAIGYEESGAERGARVWPAVVIVGLFWVARLAIVKVDLPLFNRFLWTLLSTVLLLILYMGWWGLDRRGRIGERRFGVWAWLIGGIVVGAMTFKSLGVMVLVLTAMPWVFTAWVVWLVVGRGMPVMARRRGLVVVILLAWGVFTLLRGEGLSGQGEMLMGWRWNKSPEERYLAEQARHAGLRASVTTAPVEMMAADWPGFRGPGRDGVVHGLTIAKDWSASPPKLVWKERVGPGWSSMCVVGERVYTQEERGDVEAVVCRDAGNGAEIWAHLDGTRFEEAMAGAGPRATPTFSEGRIYALTARGLLLCLDAASGEKVWQRDVAAESGAALPIWGYCSSPLIEGGRVIVFAGGEPKGVLAYDAKDGTPAWTAAAGKVSYGSVQKGEVAGETQLLVWSDKGLVAMDPASGAVRWDLGAGAASGMPRSLQPHVVAGGVLVASEDAGAARMDVTREGGAWHATQKWKTTQFRPSFTDFVVKGDYLYGVSAGGMYCMDVRDGKRMWRKGRFGAGQVVLLDDQSLVIVQCESGEVALVAVGPEGMTEVGRFQAIEGKTWNHPAVARGKLYVRNGEEMGCFELKREGKDSKKD